MYFPSGWRALGCDCLFPPPTPSSVLGPLHVCQAQAGVWFSVPTVPGAIHYIWNIDAQDTLVSGQGTDSIFVNFSANPGMRAISVIASNPCGNSTAYNISVDVSDPDPSFTVQPNPVSTWGPSLFTANTPGLSYAWTFQGGTPASSVNVIESTGWSSPGNYPVSLTVTDADGCISTAFDTVSVVNCVQGGNITFTNCGATANIGPSQSQCDNTYGAGVVSVSGGIQYWTVSPGVCTITIEAWGAQGGPNANLQGGLGARMKGTFQVSGGTTLKILVGQMGNGGTGGGGGGGGTFVTLTDNTPLIIAGGGGGCGGDNNAISQGVNATSSTCGTADSQGFNGTACNGLGGGAGTSSNCAAGGGGLLGDGTDGYPVADYDPGRAFVNGGQGGTATNLHKGGFGGGGSTHLSDGTTTAGGGGGGYSGGAGGSRQNGRHGGGGGGSYNAGTNQSNSSGVWAGHGKVTITW